MTDTAMELVKDIVNENSSQEEYIDDENTLGDLSGEPLSVQLLTNLNCNLDCKYCYENKRGAVNNVKDMCDFIEAMVKTHIRLERPLTKGLLIEYIGGESLLYPKMLDEVNMFALNIARQYNFPTCKFSISSNGTRFDDPDVRWFIEKWARFLNIGLSVDGIKEIHDDQRITTEGKGTYDTIVSSLNWLWTKINNRSTKATFCHNTMNRYAECVKHLIYLGFNDIAANFIFEEKFNMDDGLIIGDQLLDLAKYIIDNGYEKQISFFQLNHEGMDLGYSYIPPIKSEENICRNHCGTCQYMRCLGFDRKIYGCNRFLTMNKPNMEIGYLNDKNEIIITKKKFIDEVKEIYKTWPEECNKCELFETCPSCSAIPYETDDPKSFFNEMNMCGFTYAQALARLYFSKKFVKKHGKVKNALVGRLEQEKINSGEIDNDQIYNSLSINMIDFDIIDEASKYGISFEYDIVRGDSFNRPCLNIRFNNSTTENIYNTIKDLNRQIINIRNTRKRVTIETMEQYEEDKKLKKILTQVKEEKDKIFKLLKDSTEVNKSLPVINNSNVNSEIDNEQLTSVNVKSPTNKLNSLVSKLKKR